MTYEQAKEDHEYLWSIGAAYDMTGGYVDSEDLTRLLKNPSKATAKACLCNQIDYWFQVGPDLNGGNRGEDVREYIQSDPRVAEIAERHGCL